MKSSRRLRKTNSIATGRWAGYAAAAAASTLAAAPSAEAAIHYSGLINHPFHGNHKGTVSLGSGAGEFVIIHSYGKYGSTSRSGNLHFQLYAGSPSVNGFVASRPPASVSNLNRGDAMSTRPFVPDGGVLASNFCGCSHGIRGQFRNRGVGYVGFKFNNGAGDQYGWVRLRVYGGPDNRGTLVDFAYGDPGRKC